MSKSIYKDPIRIHCPCADSPADAPPPQTEDEVSTPSTEDVPEQTRRIFDSSLTRARYSLHPLAYLYFCQECQAIRCPRCVQEEIVSAFCPMCLFEVPLTSIKADGNRCVRNCFQCPICFSGLSVFPNEETQAAPYTLNCMYCQWSSTEIGIEFEKPTGISAQLSKLEPPFSEEQAKFEVIRDHYANLFDTARPSEDVMASFSSRYSSLLSGKGSFKARQSSRTLFSRMRPPSRDNDDKPLEYEEVKLLDDEEALIERMKSLTSLEETTTMVQRSKQPTKPRWEQELWPINMHLRAKRSKRCRACRHILVKPENKPTSTRFRIKMLALNYIPAIKIKSYSSLTTSTPSLIPKPPAHILTPGTTHSFILTITNPLYDPIQLTLSTPATAPGPYAHKTTILKPEFTVGANADIWNDDEDVVSPSDKDKRKSKFGIFEARRNMISIFMEVVPAITSNKDTPASDKDGNDELEKEVPVEIPIFVKMRYQTEDVEKEDTLTLVNQALEEKGKGKVEREIGYWVVVKVGSIMV